MEEQMITIEEKVINQIPCLEVVNENLKDEKLPLVLFYHGFESTNDRSMQYAYLLAKQGNRVVLPEIIHHGSRNPLKSKQEMEFAFWNIIFTTIEEIEIIKDTYEANNLIKDEKIIIGGSSMGGMIVYGALVKYPWIKAAASFMGMPAFETFANYLMAAIDTSILPNELKEMVLSECRKRDITQQLEVLQNRPLFIWHGKNDTTVPIEPVQKFYQNIEKMYNLEDGMLEFVIDESAGHYVPNSGVYSFVNWMYKVSK